MVKKKALYGLKSSRAAFRAKLASLLHHIRYTPSKADPGFWIRPSIKSDGAEYYKYDLVYVDSVLVIICVSIKTIKGIKFVFKLKGNKAEPPKMYLGASLQQLEMKGRTKMSKNMSKPLT